MIVNTAKSPEAIELETAVNIATTNATDWAKEAGLIVSGAVLFNTTILGGFSKATGLISMDSIEKALRHHFQGQAADKNIRGAWLAYEGTMNLDECQLACA